ncbi:MAG: transporter associated domain-containing protein [Pseudomonadota bacterium]|nr:transporter associated domain-containing protein [Pseudomonadota bacterium]
MNDFYKTNEPVLGIIARIRRLLKVEPSSRQDLIDLLHDKRWNSFLENQELRMLKGVLQVAQMQVREVMIPRSQMVVLERESPAEEMLQRIIERGHSRYPVIGEDRDEVVGILLAKDVLKSIIENPNQKLIIDGFLRQATFIPESKRLDALLQEFRSSRNHMAIVVDEYGGISGLLTIEDVLEEIVGEIDDEHDPEEVEQIQAHESHWSILALTRIDTFNEYFSSSLSDENYDTLGGLLMRGFGRLPRRGESLLQDGFRFKVEHADRRRIHRLVVTREESLEQLE